MKKIKSIIIDGNRYEVGLIPADRRTVSLKMISSLVIEVRYPSFISPQKALEYVKAKSGWIARKHTTLKVSEAAGAGQGIYEGRMLYYSGRKYKIIFSGDEIGINGENLFIPHESNQSDLEEWYKYKSVKMVNGFIKMNCSKIPDCTIKVKKQKNIWGSCNSKNRIYINSRISMCPSQVVEYILWHEISHLEHMNHSKDFYRQLSRYCPSYKQAKAWLKNNSQLLKL